ncbi:hypothetical protein LCGC14_2753280, partial [marine sediment metagenome]
MAKKKKQSSLKLPTSEKEGGPVMYKGYSIKWLKELIGILTYLKIIDKKIGIKADVNVSIKNGERIEMKNINSLKNIKMAIEYEIQRQGKPGELPKKQETRMFDEKKGITIKMREKEFAEEYR